MLWTMMRTSQPQPQPEHTSLPAFDLPPWVVRGVRGEGEWETMKGVGGESGDC